MKTHANQLSLGYLLNGRYQIVQVKSARSWSQTYIVADTRQNGQPQCIVKHFQPQGIHPKYWRFGKRLFDREVDILKKLGNYSQIPKLLDSFADDRGFYIAQELIVGNRLSQELPISRYCNKRWSEYQCVKFLNDIFGILEFVHRQGVIHGNINPDNLIRRKSDGRFVLIDFGEAYQINSASQVKAVEGIGFSSSLSLTSSFSPLTSHSRYAPKAGFPHPNSDLYGIGAIAIQAITRLNPEEFPINPDTGEISWEQHASVSESMAFVLNHTVQQDPQKRFQSATDALIVLKTLVMSCEVQQVSNQEFVNELAVEQTIKPTNNQILEPNWFNFPPLITATGVGIAASNTVAISLGLYSLLYAAPSNPALDLLERARIEYDEGNFNEAIALAQSIPTDSSLYQKSVSTVQKWRQEWYNAEAQYKAAAQALIEERWHDVLLESRKINNVKIWQRKTQPLVEEAKLRLEAEAQELLAMAYGQAAQKDFTSAIAFLKQIPPETPTGAKIYPKLSEYQEKQRIKAQSLLQQAYQRAGERDFKAALNYLTQIPEDTPTYQTAQVKMAEYSQKQASIEEVKRIVELDRAAQGKSGEISDRTAAESSVNTDSTGKTVELNPGEQLQEVKPKI
ncbi:serine/threonine protein kinase [Limnofasciculus baicalensis]|uniref:non-specific serine/threonine protein kinase n=1 Tax=Limnofasciculus baicalensis BBK-W-15 TaxID=2699891 RepID=A0AAE3KPI3_9CYAN|nr:serine/threonine-protein kinase [Limnofasciculus baicalensis]MCP2729673.1 serine/threonine-protein kinase [Limnofasciculus baicalensis BBK-W-15]